MALDVKDLAVSFGGVQAVRDVSLDVRQGQIVGIIGPNGAGKTTVLDLISGFVPPTSGVVSIGGDDVTALSPDARAVLGLGRSFQDARLFSAMTVRQTIATALERHVRVRDPIAPLVLSPAVTASERAVAAEVDDLIDLMNLGAYADKFVGELSTGTRRVVDLACTLAHRPSVLLLDEPSSGIAQRETEALGPVLLDIRDQTGAALVVIEHDMPLICGVSDELDRPRARCGDRPRPAERGHQRPTRHRGLPRWHRGGHPPLGLQRLRPEGRRPPPPSAALR